MIYKGDLLESLDAGSCDGRSRKALPRIGLCGHSQLGQYQPPDFAQRFLKEARLLKGKLPVQRITLMIKVTFSITQASDFLDSQCSSDMAELRKK